MGLSANKLVTAFHQTFDVMSIPIVDLVIIQTKCVRIRFFFFIFLYYLRCDVYFDYIEIRDLV